MKLISKETVYALIDAKGDLDHHVRSQLDRASVFYETQIEDAETLENIVFHFHRHSQLLTPKKWWGGGQVSTIGRVLDFMAEKDITFQKLANREIPGVYSANWFKPCQAIYEAFDPNRMAPVLLRLCHPHDLADAPQSLFKTVDGLHRMTAYALLLREKKEIFKPFSAIVIPK